MKKPIYSRAASSKQMLSYSNESFETTVIKYQYATYIDGVEKWHYLDGLQEALRFKAMGATIRRIIDVRIHKVETL